MYVIHELNFEMLYDLKFSNFKMDNSTNAKKVDEEWRMCGMQ